MKDMSTAILDGNTLPHEPRSSTRGPFARVSAALSDSVVRKGLLSVFDQAVVSGTSFITSVAIGRMCSQSELGIYYLALSIFLFTKGLQEQLVSAPYTIYCNRHRGTELDDYTGSTFAHQFGISATVIAGLAGFAYVSHAGYGPIGFSSMTWILVGTIPFLMFREHLRQFAFARLSVTTAIRIDIAVAGLQLATLAMLAWLGWLSAAAVFLVMGGSCAAAGLGWFLFRQHSLRIKSNRIKSDWKKNWSFSKWALSSHLVGSSTPYIMPWFVAAVQGNAATGVMAACNTLVGLANSFVMGLLNYLTPKSAHAYANDGIPGLRRVLRKTTLIFGVTLGGFCAGAFLAGDWVAVLVYGEAYSGAGIIIGTFAVALWAGSIGMTAGNGLWAMDKPSANFKADLISLGVTILTAVILTPLYGVLGAAISTLCGTVTDAAIRWWTLQNLMREVEQQIKTENEQ
jgi:O-antigen/teichoic acid export membrane protein